MNDQSEKKALKEQETEKSFQKYVGHQLPKSVLLWWSCFALFLIYYLVRYFLPAMTK